MQVEIQKIVYPGRSLSFEGGKALFTDSGLPGEIVEVEPFAEKKNYIEARTVRVLKASPHRVEGRCDHLRACSPYQTISYPHQLEIKRAQVQELFAHNLGIELQDFSVTPSPQVWGYRNKVRLHVLWKGGTASFAYHEPGLRQEFVAIGECYLLGKGMNRLQHELRRILTDKKLEAIEEIEIKESSSGQGSLLNLYLRNAVEKEELDGVFSELKSDFPELGLRGFLKARSSVKQIFARGRDSIEEKVGGRVFRIGPRSFFQVNVSQLKRVVVEIKQALSLAGSEKLADLYCGVGTFGMILAADVREVFGVEPDPENVIFLKKNLRANGIGNFSVCEGRSEEWARELLDNGLDVAVLDPPRKGVDESVCDALLTRPAALVVYLSCNPATLVRDLKRLLRVYRLRNLRGYDFFPHTPHIETLAIMCEDRQNIP